MTNEHSPRYLSVEELLAFHKTFTNTVESGQAPPEDRHSRERLTRYAPADGRQPPAECFKWAPEPALASLGAILSSLRC